MKTYTFAIQKGGTGKTSISLSVAVELAKFGRTVIIDADPQGNSTDWINIPQINGELSDVLSGKCAFKDAIHKTSQENLYIIPTAGINGGLRNYKESFAQKEPFKIAQLKAELAKVFDYCVIDTSPDFDALTEQCLIACDEVINVLKLDKFSQDGLKTFRVNLDDLKQRYNNCYGVSTEGAPYQRMLILNENNSSFSRCRELITQYKQLEPRGFKIFVVPQEQGFPKAQNERVILQNMAGIKKDTLNSIREIAEALK